MTENIYNAPEASLTEESNETCNVALWNPDAAGAWSLLFSPLFGSILVYKNWKALGEEEQAKKSKKWIYISAPMALLSALLGVFGLIYIAVWYFTSQKKQTQYLKSKFSGNYPKKGWLKPLGIAFGCLLGLVALIVGLVAVTGFGSA